MPAVRALLAAVPPCPFDQLPWASPWLAGVVRHTMMLEQETRWRHRHGPSPCPDNLPARLGDPAPALERLCAALHRAADAGPLGEEYDTHMRAAVRHIQRFYCGPACDTCVFVAPRVRCSPD